MRSVRDIHFLNSMIIYINSANLISRCREYKNDSSILLIISISVSSISLSEKKYSITEWVEELAINYIIRLDEERLQGTVKEKCISNFIFIRLL